MNRALRRLLDTADVVDLLGAVDAPLIAALGASIVSGPVLAVAVVLVTAGFGLGQPALSAAVGIVIARELPKQGTYTECVPGPPATMMRMSSGRCEIVSSVSGPIGPSSAVREACVRPRSSAAMTPARNARRVPPLSVPPLYVTA